MQNIPSVIIALLRIRWYDERKKYGVRSYVQYYNNRDVCLLRNNTRALPMSTYSDVMLLSTYTIT